MKYKNSSGEIFTRQMDVSGEWQLFNSKGELASTGKGNWAWQDYEIVYERTFAEFLRIINSADLIRVIGQGMEKYLSRADFITFTLPVIKVEPVIGLNREGGITFVCKGKAEGDIFITPFDAKRW